MLRLFLDRTASGAGSKCVFLGCLRAITLISSEEEDSIQGRCLIGFRFRKTNKPHKPIAARARPRRGLGRSFHKLVQWITQRQKICMEIGERLSSEATRDAQTIGVGQIDEVRIMVEGKISLPSDPELLQLFLKSVPAVSNGITCGHGIKSYNRKLWMRR
jgi:hypothetical protein